MNKLCNECINAKSKNELCEGCKIFVDSYKCPPMTTCEYIDEEACFKCWQKYSKYSTKPELDKNKSYFRSQNTGKLFVKYVKCCYDCVTVYSNKRHECPKCKRLKFFYITGVQLKDIREGMK